LTTNLQSVLTLARWARQFLAGWTSAIAYAWQYVLFFSAESLPPRMPLCSPCAGFAIINMIAKLGEACTETPRSKTIRTMRVVSIVLGVRDLVDRVLFRLRQGVDGRSSKRRSRICWDVGYYTFAWERRISRLQTWCAQSLDRE